VHKIRFTGNFGGGKLNNYFERLSQGEGRWNDIQTVDSGEDTEVVVNCSRGCDLSNSIALQMEPNSSIRKFPGIFKDLGGNRNKLKFAFDTKTYRNSIEWHISPSYTDLKNEIPDLTKTKTLSTVVSAKRKLPGHRARIRLLIYLVDNLEIDVWGKGHAKKWISDSSPSRGREMGELPFREKDIALFPFKYHLACENTPGERNYFTEKIVDGILSECLCFYAGCPNLGDFIDSRSYIPIPVNDHAKTLQIIQSSIASNQWEKRLPYILESKQKILDELQIYPTLERIINEENNIF
tara:strand:- start:3117 stop:4001 length:885 start_codon:yes stop_codon:yes gene_type:complete